MTRWIELIIGLPKIGHLLMTFDQATLAGTGLPDIVEMGLKVKILLSPLPPLYIILTYMYFFPLFPIPDEQSSSFASTSK